MGWLLVLLMALAVLAGQTVAAVIVNLTVLVLLHAVRPRVLLAAFAVLADQIVTALVGVLAGEALLLADGNAGAVMTDFVAFTVFIDTAVGIDKVAMVEMRIQRVD
jgi:hypothetical protein